MKLLLSITGLLLVLLQSSIASKHCRVSPSAEHDYCGMPLELSNFQGRFRCPEEVLIGRPQTIDELQQIVTSYPKVKAAGNGHSFNANMLCAGVTNDSVNILTTEIISTKNNILAPPSPDRWLKQQMPADFPIVVDEDAQTVTVAAGIPQRILLNYLSEYTHWKEPKGWVLPAFSWFIDQTIAGAVATGTHGSSMRWGSLSAQMESARLMLSNGTIIEITPDQEHLWRAMGVSVGQLGLLVNVTMRIMPQQAVKKTVEKTNIDSFVKFVNKVQDQYIAAKESGNMDAIKEALFNVDELQTFWFVPEGIIWNANYEHLTRTPFFVKENIAPEEVPSIEAFDGPGIGGEYVYQQQYVPPVPPKPQITQGAAEWSRFFRMILSQYGNSGTFDSRKAYLSMVDTSMALLATFAPYDQYEVAVPLEKAGTCLSMLQEMMYGPKNLSQGFRTPALIRWTPGESFYLTYAQNGPHMFVNIEDYITPSLKTGRNEKFLEVIDTFISKCDARLHWGKAGFIQANVTYNPVEKFGDNWCHFGCAVQQLDPTLKFQGDSPIWQWNATKGGEQVQFDSCCSSNGFLSNECTCTYQNA